MIRPLVVLALLAALAQPHPLSPATPTPTPDVLHRVTPRPRPPTPAPTWETPRTPPAPRPLGTAVWLPIVGDPLVHKEGAIDREGKVRPLGEWVR